MNRETREIVASAPLWFPSRRRKSGLSCEGRLIWKAGAKAGELAERADKEIAKETTERATKEIAKEAEEKGAKEATEKAA